LDSGRLTNGKSLPPFADVRQISPDFAKHWQKEGAGGRIGIARGVGGMARSELPGCGFPSRQEIDAMQHESRLTATTPDGKCHPAKPTWKEELSGFSVAVEMGADRTRVFVQGHGIAADEASAVFFEKKRNGQRGKVRAVGDEVLRQEECVRPVVRGCIEDLDAAAALLRGVLEKSGALAGFRGPRLVLAWSRCGSADGPEKAWRDAAVRAGAREVYLVESPMAAMIGTGEEVTDKETRMVLHVEADAAEAALVRQAQSVRTETLPPSGQDDRVAALAELAERCARSVSGEERASLARHGVWLTGGKAFLPGLRDAVAARTGLPVRISRNPGLAVLLGMGRILDELTGIGRTS
jgi:actin-like ATPase involved in cell morphogenesis